MEVRGIYSALWQVNDMCGHGRSYKRDANTGLLGSLKSERSLANTAWYEYVKGYTSAAFLWDVKWIFTNKSKCTLLLSGRTKWIVSVQMQPFHYSVDNLCLIGWWWYRSAVYHDYKLARNIFQEDKREGFCTDKAGLIIATCGTKWYFENGWAEASWLACQLQ